MKTRRLRNVVALIAVGALTLSGCVSEAPEGNGTSSPGTPSSGAPGSVDPANTGKAALGDVVTKDDTISYTLGEVEWTGYNGNTPETYSTYTSVVNDRLIGGFVYFGTDGEIYQNEEYGTFKLANESPMSVEYTLNDAAVWSDGVAIAYEDYLLDWATQAISDGVDADGAPQPLFNHVGGLDFGERVLEGPKGEVGGKTFTYDYKDPYPDYKLQVGGAFPAHVVAEKAGLTVEELVKAIQDKDLDKLRPAAKFWNEDWLSPNAGTLPDEALTPVSGPYKLGNWVAGESITLVSNDKYWGTPPATKTLVYRFVAPDAQVQALKNGDLNVIEPQSVIDTIEQIKGIGDSVTLMTGPTLTWEHLDFNFKSGAFKDSLELRQAFAMCVPRQRIVDNLIKPVDPEAVVMNAREVFPFQPDYADVVGAAYDGRYDEVDIDGAKAKIAEAGIATPIKVRIGYSAGNQRRTDQVALIKSSCDEAGFEIEDVSSKKFFDKTLPNGDYEVALFAWAGSGQIVSGQNIYSSTGAQNYGGFKNKNVDAAWDTLSATLDRPAQLEQVKTIEKELWDNLFGIPVFAHPGVVAYDSTVKNVRQSSTQSTVAWNAEQWAR